jgi:hypothetical protein
LATSITRPYVVEEEEVPKRCALGLCVATTKEVDGQAVCVCCAELPQDAEGLAKNVCADCAELPFAVELVGEVSDDQVEGTLDDFNTAWLSASTENLKKLMKRK